MKIIQIVIGLVLLVNVSLFAEELKIVAHRGASKAAPENTIPAFKLAWEQGADVIEGDFLLTKDGHIVCIHDRSTKRVANQNKVVSKSTLAELRVLDVGERRNKDFKGTVIPTISEVFSTIPEGKTIFIEIKCGVEIITPLLKEIKKSGLKKEQIVVICFNKMVIKAFKEKAPEYKASWLCGVKKKTSSAAILKTLKEIHADGLSSSKGATESFVADILKHGYEFHVWTINDAKTAKQFKEWGVKSITTDIPGQLRRSLVE